jgi:hypothetical protein
MQQMEPQRRPCDEQRRFAADSAENKRANGDYRRIERVECRMLKGTIKLEFARWNVGANP